MSAVLASCCLFGRYLRGGGHTTAWQYHIKFLYETLLTVTSILVFIVYGRFEVLMDVTPRNGT